MTPYSQSSGYSDLYPDTVGPVGSSSILVDNNYEGTTTSSSALYVTQLKPGSYTIVSLTMQDYPGLYQIPQCGTGSSTIFMQPWYR